MSRPIKSSSVKLGGAKRGRPQNNLQPPARKAKSLPPVAQNISKAQASETLPISSASTSALELHIISHLDSGGMGNVFRGAIYDPSLPPRSASQVFIKTMGVLHEALRERTRTRFEWEALISYHVAKEAPEIAPRVFGSYIPGEDCKVKVFNKSGQRIEAPLLVMDYVDGILLSDLIDHGLFLRQMPSAKVNVFAYHLLKALEKLDSIDVVHRDIKPENIMISRNGNIVILDYGLSVLSIDGKYYRLIGEEHQRWGTAHYMAPEYLKGGREKISNKQDTWAAGLTVIELLTGKHPFGGEESYTFGDIEEISAQIVNGRPLDESFITDQRRDVSPELVKVLMGLLERDPARRYDASTATTQMKRHFGDQIDQAPLNLIS